MATGVGLSGSVRMIT